MTTSGWHIYKNDPVTSPSLWKTRKFNSAQELNKYANNVFNEIGFKPFPFLVEELNDKEVSFVKRVQNCRREALKLKENLLDYAINCLR